MLEILCYDVSNQFLFPVSFAIFVIIMWKMRVFL